VDGEGDTLPLFFFRDDWGNHGVHFSRKRPGWFGGDLVAVWKKGANGLSKKGSTRPAQRARADEGEKSLGAPGKGADGPLNSGNDPGGERRRGAIWAWRNRFLSEPGQEWGRP